MTEKIYLLVSTFIFFAVALVVNICFTKSARKKVDPIYLEAKSEIKPYLNGGCCAATVRQMLWFYALTLLYSFTAGKGNIIPKIVYIAGLGLLILRGYFFSKMNLNSKAHMAKYSLKECRYITFVNFLYSIITAVHFYHIKDIFK